MQGDLQKRRYKPVLQPMPRPDVQHICKVEHVSTALCCRCRSYLRHSDPIRHGSRPIWPQAQVKRVPHLDDNMTQLQKRHARTHTHMCVYVCVCLGAEATREIQPQLPTWAQERSPAILEHETVR